MEGDFSETKWHDRLIDHVYASALGEASWGDFLQLLASPVPGAKGTFVRQWRTPQRGEAAEATYIHGFDQSFIRTYLDHYGSVNPWMDRAHGLKQGLVNTSDFLYSPQKMEQSEFLNDWLKPQNLTNGCFLIVRKDLISASVLTFLQPGQHVTMVDPLPRALSVLAPHLLRAARITDTDRTARSLDRVLVERLSLAVIYLTDERRLIYANHRARDLLARGDGVRTQPMGQLHLADQEADDAIAAVLRVGTGQARVRVARTRRASGRPLQVLLIRPALDAAERFFIGGRLILLLNDPDDPAHADAASLVKAYGLSPAEQRLAQGLLEGQRLDEMAESWRLSKQTLRSQLASALAKMGVSSQSDLVREGMQSPSSRIHDP